MTPPRGTPRKLTPEQVIEMRALRRDGDKLDYLAHRYGVGRETARRILYGITYADVPGRIYPGKRVFS